jgi:hypothetical protein
LVFDVEEILRSGSRELEVDDHFVAALLLFFNSPGITGAVFFYCLQFGDHAIAVRDLHFELVDLVDGVLDLFDYFAFHGAEYVKNSAAGDPERSRLNALFATSRSEIEEIETTDLDLKNRAFFTVRFTLFDVSR